MKSWSWSVARSRSHASNNVCSDIFNSDEKLQTSRPKKFETSSIWHATIMPHFTVLLAPFNCLVLPIFADSTHWPFCLVPFQVTDFNWPVTHPSICKPLHLSCMLKLNTCMSLVANTFIIQTLSTLTLDLDHHLNPFILSPFGYLLCPSRRGGGFLDLYKLRVLVV